MRVHELAKELGIGSKELMSRLHELGVEVKNQLAAVDAALAEKVRASFAAKGEASAAPAPAPAELPVVRPPARPTQVYHSQAHLPVEDDEEEDVVAAPVPRPVPIAPPTPPRGKTPPPPPPRPKAPPAPKAPPPSPVAPVAPPKAKTLRVSPPIIVRDFAPLLGLRPNQLVAECMAMNIFASINDRLELPAAVKLAERHGFHLEAEKKPVDRPVAPTPDRLKEPEQDQDRPEDLVPRPPVVTFMGHVDHGKTSLLDYIRKTTVAKGEHGGITQHIGASTVEAGGKTITFLDTPGHAAFTAMRARGATLTDIVVIIVAADDGIMQQTREAIQHAKAAGVQIMVAINKVDLPTANVMRVRQQLQAEDLAPEDWGGTTICCEVSAVTGKGVDHLLEMILLQAEILDLKANPKRRASGFVIEAQMEPGMGPTAHLLVKTGTLNVGDCILCGPYVGRVKALTNDRGNRIKSAGPATPVKCLGLAGVPDAGADFQVYANEKVARTLAEERQQTQRERQQQVGMPRKASLDAEALFTQMRENEKVELKAVLKADTQGSVEAILHALRDIRSDKVTLSMILSGTGNVTGNDVMLASASGAVILGFHVAKEPGVDGMAKREGVEIHLHTIIYEMLDQVRAAMLGLLAPETRLKVHGHALVKQIFPVGKTSVVAGCIVTDGTIGRKQRVRVRRENEILFEGTVASMRHYQDDVSEVRQPQECGIRLNNYDAYKPGDILEFYEMEEIAQTL